MNNYYSRPELYYNRWLTPNLQEASQDHQVVVLTGARQVGKTTLLRNAEPFKDWRFHTLDNFDTLHQARERPEELWAGTDQVVLDEVQKAPELLSAVKQAVDHKPGRLKFALSGSANLLLMHRVSESLAGRAIYLVLHPLTMGEINQVAPSNILFRILDGDWLEEGLLPREPPDPIESLLRGFMPNLLTLNSSRAWTRWWDGYIATYLERDLRQISQIANLVDFRRLMVMAALRNGQILNQSELARDAQLPQPTAHRYLNILETTFLFERLPAYTVNRTSRLIKSPKIYWNDPALAVFLSGYFDGKSLREARELGSYFETMIFHHLRVLTSLMTPPARLYFWRTRDGKEVDFVVEHGRRLLGIEVKWAIDVGFGDARHLRSFIEEYPEASGGLILYGGRKIRRLGEKIIAIPWVMLTG